MTGHDLVFYLRYWLWVTHNESRSICEVIVSDPSFQHMREYVGTANVFWSHVQLEPFAGLFSEVIDEHGHKQVMCSTLYSLFCADSYDTAHILPPFERRFHWLDYFTLRQCQPDFNPYVIVQIIKEIGTVGAVVQFGKGIGYFEHSCCMLDMYGCVAGKCGLICINNETIRKEELRQILIANPAAVTIDYCRRHWNGPIDAKAARAHRDVDKKLIDDFIMALPGGFDYVNEVVTEALVSACPNE